MERKSLILLIVSPDELVLSKKVAKYLGNDTSYLLSCMIQKDYKTENKIDIDGVPYFEYTSDEIKEDANISYKQQKTAIQNLIDIGFLSQKRIGLPSKLHFSLNYKKINELL